MATVGISAEMLHISEIRTETINVNKTPQGK